MLKAKSRIKNLCELHHGKFIEGRWGKGPYMVLNYKGFEMVFDFYTVNAGQTNLIYTRMRCVFKHTQLLKFKMRKASWLSKLLKSKTLTFEDLNLDGRYQIKASDEAVVYELLKEGRLSNYLNFRKFYNFEINQKTNRGLKCEPGESGIIFYTSGAIKDDEEIQKIIDLYKITLDTLVALNLSSEGPVTTKLYEVKS